jgi:SSS family solute:Na+ symporter
MRLPELVGAILLGGVFAKVISTANNYLFSPASNLIHDVYKRFIDPQASERRTLIVSRVLVIALGAFALLQAAYFESVLKAALYAYTVYGAAVTPSVMAVFFWKRANKAGAISSVALGTLITVAWNILQTRWPDGLDAVYPRLSELDAVYPALGVSVLALVVVSLATAPPTRANLEPFEK